MSKINIVFDCEKCAQPAEFVMRIERLEDSQGSDNFVSHPHRAALICRACAWAQVTSEPWFTVRLPSGRTQHVVSERMAAHGVDFEGVTSVPAGATPARVVRADVAAALTFDELSAELRAHVGAVANDHLSAILFDAIEEREHLCDLDSLA